MLDEEDRFYSNDDCNEMNTQRFTIEFDTSYPINGLPTGGTQGSLLIKQSNNDFDTQWTLPADTVTQTLDIPVTSSAVYNALSEIHNWYYVICNDASNTPAGITWDNQGVIITGILQASSDTECVFYMVPQSNVDNLFDEYITVRLNGSYVWEKLGSQKLPDMKQYVKNSVNHYDGVAKELAYKDSASGSYTPAGSVSQPTFTGSNLTSSGKFTPNGTVSVSTDTTENKTATVAPAQSGESTYTPTGSVAAPTISVSAAGETTTVNSITAVGTLPELTMTVANEILTIGWNAGTLPTKGSDTTVKVSDASYQASAPAFTGTAVRLVTDNIAVPATYTASFSGTEGDVSVAGTPSGTVSQPTFTGTTETITVT